MKIDNNLRIVQVGDIMQENLRIAEYQRPYRWSTESALTLLQDIYDAFLHNIPEYRMGSIVLHHDKSQFNVVDGQQRLTTLSIMIFILEDIFPNKRDKNLSGLLQAEYNELSAKTIEDNYIILNRKIRELEKLEDFTAYLLDRCTLVRIVTQSEQEAFQFFDSQNSRGKPLSPQDLLKAYHLREMNQETEEIREKIIEIWEDTQTNKLDDLFASSLFPLLQWNKGKSGLDYSEKDIQIFKGIKRNNQYNFSVYHKAAHLYIERFNSENMYELTFTNPIHQFQLTQPVIAGKRFFQYTHYYFNLRQKIQALVASKLEDKNLKIHGSGDIYVRNLLSNVLMFYIDRFNLKALTEERFWFLFRWAFSLRICMQRVSEKSINKYAQGRSDRINSGLNMFSMIAEMQDPVELDMIILEDIADTDIVVNPENYSKELKLLGIDIKSLRMDEDKEIL